EEQVAFGTPGRRTARGKPYGTCGRKSESINNNLMQSRKTAAAEYMRKCMSRPAGRRNETEKKTNGANKKTNKLKIKNRRNLT
ncbi:MAG: hypothetical protein K2G19_10795, partial [Lachnospiraceae bacterium]|nr:hypothetical protein [Lachnospiraceae bacterium]